MESTFTPRATIPEKIVGMAFDASTGQLQKVFSLGETPAVEKAKDAKKKRADEIAEEEAAPADDNLKGVICLDISKDQEWVAACSYNTSRVFLFRRNLENGELTQVSQIKGDGEEVTGLGLPISVKLSPDAKFIYVANGIGSLTVFSIVDDKINFLQRHIGLEGEIDGCRVMSTNPEGTHFFIPCDTSHSLAVFDRDPEEGHVRVLQDLS